MTYYDMEHDIYMSSEELEATFNKLKAAGETEAETFNEYIENCMDFNDGILEINERTVALDVLSHKGRKMVGCNGNSVERVDMIFGKYALHAPGRKSDVLTSNIETVFEWLEI